MSEEAKRTPAHRRESKSSWKIILAVLGAVCLVALLAVGAVMGYSMYEAGKVNQPEASNVAKTATKTASAKISTPPPPKEVQITLAATGDVLAHDPVV